MASAARVAAEAGDEGPVDLHDVDGEAAQVAQRRVAGAEVVDGQPHAERPAARPATAMATSTSSIRTLSVISKQSRRGASVELVQHVATIGTRARRR